MIKFTIMNAKTNFLMALLLVLSMPFKANSQDFIRALQVAGSGFDFIKGVTTDSQGNIIIDGRFQYSVDFDPSDNEAILESISNNDAFFAKYSPAGGYIWAKQLAGGSAQRIRNDKNDNIYITGYTYSQLDLDPSEGEAIVNADQKAAVFLAKYNPQGEYIWGFAVESKNGSTSSWDVEVDDMGNCVYMVGTCSDTMDFDPSENTYNLITQNFQDLFVAKYTLDGEFVWVKHLAFQGYGYGDLRTITVDNTGNFYIGGIFEGTLDMDPGDGTYMISSDYEGNEDAFLAKYNSSGEIQWAFSLGDTSLMAVVWTLRCFGDKIYAAGSFYGTVDFDPSEETYELTSYSELDESGFLAVYNDDGTFYKAMGMIGTADESGCQLNDMGKDADGNIYLLGSFYGTLDFDPSNGIQNITSSGDYDMFLSKYSADGSYIWSIHTDGNEQEQGYFLQVVGNNHVIAFGYYDGTCDFDPSDGTAYLYNKGGHDVYMAWYSATHGSSVNEPGNTAHVKIFPNPVKDDCVIQLNLASNSYVKIRVTDLLGKDILAAENLDLTRGIHQIFIPSHSFKPGTYMLWGEIGSQRFVQKLIKF
jgi:hypothetical protein